MMSNYDIGYVNSNKFTNDLVEKSKVKYGEEKVKFEILDALIRYYEAEHDRVNNVGQNQQTTTTIPRSSNPFSRIPTRITSDFVGFRRNPTKHGRDSIGLYAVPVVSDDRNPTQRITTTHSRDPTEIIWIRWDPTGHN